MSIHRHKKNVEEMWKSLKRMFVTNRLIPVTTVLSVLFLCITVALPVWRLLPLATQTPFIALHYNIYLGVDRFGPINQIFFLPGVGFFFLLVNLFVQARTYKNQKTLSFFFAASTPLLEFILCTAMALIVLTNV